MAAPPPAAWGCPWEAHGAAEAAVVAAARSDSLVLGSGLNRLILRPKPGRSLRTYVSVSWAEGETT